MNGYDSWHRDTHEQANNRRQAGAIRAAEMMYTVVETTNTTAAPVSRERDALIDIAHDCGTLEAAQRRAKEALK